MNVFGSFFNGNDGFSIEQISAAYDLIWPIKIIFREAHPYDRSCEDAVFLKTVGHRQITNMIRVSEFPLPCLADDLLFWTDNIEQSNYVSLVRINIFGYII